MRRHVGPVAHWPATSVQEHRRSVDGPLVLAERPGCADRHDSAGLPAVETGFLPGSGALLVSGASAVHRILYPWLARTRVSVENRTDPTGPPGILAVGAKYLHDL